MIPVTPGDVFKTLGAIKQLIDLIQRPERANKLKKWADLLGEPKDPDDIEDLKQERAAFLIALTQDLGFTPWYVYNARIAIPKDVMADLVDLLVSGPSRSRAGWLTGMFGTKKPKDEYEEWADVITSGKDADILDCLVKFLTCGGRTRHYEDAAPTIYVDPDWLADAGMALLNQL